MEEAAAWLKRNIHSLGVPVLALGVAYLGFQMLRNDAPDLGPHTPHPIHRGQAWNLAPDMRLFNPPAPVQMGARVRISATDNQGMSYEELADLTRQGLQQSTGYPVRMNVTFRDNTNRLPVDWWQEKIAEALGY